MKFLTAFLAPALLVCLAMPADAQTKKRDPKKTDTALEAAKKRCKENRGTDCESNAGLNEWLRQERKLTPAQRQAAAAARKHRETCAKTRGAAAGC